jgi:hypothetical protein
LSSTLRRGGSVAAFRWEGRIADPRSAEFLEALSRGRFRSIERAANEETSAGWVTPSDPTGDSFELEDLVAGGHWWLRIRVDAKKFPASKLQMEIAAHERTRGKRLSARDLRELKDHLHEQMLPGILPRTQFVDVLVHRELRSALLLSTSKAARETFGKLAKEAFGVEPRLQTSGEFALGEHGEQIGRLQPTVFPGGGPRQLVLATSADFLGQEFLLWLWWKWETAGGEFALRGGRIAGIAIDDRVEFAAGADETSLVLRRGLTTRAIEARAALRAGRVPSKVRLLVAESDRQWTVTLDGAAFALTSARLPDDSDGCESREDRVAERAANWLDLHGIAAELFELFLGDRLASWESTQREVAAWMRGGAP